MDGILFEGIIDETLETGDVPQNAGSTLHILSVKRRWIHPP